MLYNFEIAEKISEIEAELDRLGCSADIDAVKLMDSNGPLVSLENEGTEHRLYDAGALLNRLRAIKTATLVKNHGNSIWFMIECAKREREGQG